MDEPLATDERGNALLSFDLADESDLKNLDLPCPLSLVLVWSGDRCLMVFDRWKRAWELPGGSREDGETPRAAAIRELVEETGQTPASLVFVGVARFRLASDGREEYGAVYRAEVARPREFEPNDEIERIVWWDPATELDGMDGPDAAIVRLVLRRS